MLIMDLQPGDAGFISMASLLFVPPDGLQHGFFVAYVFGEVYPVNLSSELRDRPFVVRGNDSLKVDASFELLKECRLSNVYMPESHPRTGQPYLPTRDLTNCVLVELRNPYLINSLPFTKFVGGRWMTN